MNETPTQEKQPTSMGESISFTADGVAYLRQFTDLPCCTQMMQVITDLGGKPDPRFVKLQNMIPVMVPAIEARYILTNELLDESGIKQIFEPASGLSPRGFIETQDLCVTYVELDFPAKIELKKKVLQGLHGERSLPKNHHFVPGSVGNKKDMSVVDSIFGTEPVFIACEGLVPYLSFEGKNQFGENMLALLKNRGGILVVSDMTTLGDIESRHELMSRYEMFTDLFGFDLRPNLFVNTQNAISFFERIGFNVEVRSYTEVLYDLSSARLLNLDIDEVKAELQNRRTFVMTAR